MLRCNLLNYRLYLDVISEDGMRFGRARKLSYNSENGVYTVRAENEGLEVFQLTVKVLVYMGLMHQFAELFCGR